MSYLITYYPQREVISTLRAYQRNMKRLIANAGETKALETNVQKSFELLICKLKEEVDLNRYASSFSASSIDNLSDKDRDNLFDQEIQIVAQTFHGSIARSEAIVYNSSKPIGKDDKEKINDIINYITVQHYLNMDRVRKSRQSIASEKARTKKKIRASTEYIVAGTAILVVNNTLFISNPLQIASSTLGAGAVLRGVADIRGS